MNSMKRQKDTTLEDEAPRLVGGQYVTEEEWRNSSRKDEEAGPKQKHCSVWMCLVVKVKSDAIRNNIA